MIYASGVYLLFLFLFVVYSLAGAYHLWRYGYAGDLTRPVMFIYLALALAVIAVSFILLFGLAII